MNALQMLAEWVKINFEYYGEPFIKIYKLLKRSNRMKTITLIIDGHEIEAQVNEEDLKKVEKKKGRAEVGEKYYIFSPSLDEPVKREETKGIFNNPYYNSGNYFLTEKECADAARVVSLWLRLKRFADEHNKNGVDFKDENTDKFFITFDYTTGKIIIWGLNVWKDIFQIYFDSAETAQKAIDEFHDELMWYFTEYGKEN